MNMILPITDSILRGELRPNILEQSLQPNELEQLIRNARKVSQKSQLMDLEFAINDTLSNLVETKDIYEEDRKTRNAAISAHKNKVFKSEVEYKYLTTEIIIDDVLPLPKLNSPLLRFYSSILDAEVLRTRLSVMYLCRAVQDDAFMRSTLKAIFRKIKFACRDAQQWDDYQGVMSLIPIKLTHLYFTLLNTYGEVFDSYEVPEYEDDFMDFVYGWKGEYPTSSEEAKYKEQCRIRKEIGNSIADLPNTTPPNNAAANVGLQRAPDKADTFLANVVEFNFLEMPMIKQLENRDKVHDLVLTMLENPGHACAMLEHLKFFEWIKTTQRNNYTRAKYDVLCSKLIMGKETGDAFHTVRMSLKSTNQNAEKYRAYAYINQVATEYAKLLNS